MKNKKVYAIVEKNGYSYAAHIEERQTLYGFDSVKVVSKAEHREARAGGMPSWGENETKRKMEDSHIQPQQEEPQGRPPRLTGRGHGPVHI